MNAHQTWLGVLFHEAAHAACGHILGLTIEGIVVVTEDELGDLVEDVDSAGHVDFREHSVGSLAEAIDWICIYFAGEIGSSFAWAMGALSGEERGETIPYEEWPLDVQLASANGRTPEQKLASHAAYTMSAEGDLKYAQEFAAKFTADPFEAAALLAYCRARTSNICSTERFSRLMNAIADSLMENQELDAFHAHARLLVADFATPLEEKTASPHDERTG